MKYLLAAFLCLAATSAFADVNIRATIHGGKLDGDTGSTYYLKFPNMAACEEHMNSPEFKAATEDFRRKLRENHVGEDVTAECVGE
jgi:hypothetical protein